MKTDFSYLIDKILKTPFTNDPFKHVYIEDFFSQDHFNEIINSQQIASPHADTDAELIDILEEIGYETISFPGCITDKNKYLKWLSQEKKVIPEDMKTLTNTSCEGFGMVFRLKSMRGSSILSSINKYICGREFNEAIARRFDIDFSRCRVDSGIQKYLTGYEISPHPDVRKKATTFMVNINPSKASEGMDHHTHYLRFKPEYKYVQEFWENSKADRCWVPWEWCNTKKMQTKNNSIVIFSPDNDTLHGVKASYDHLSTQRTQLYGNMWYKKSTTGKTINWENLSKLKKI